MRWMPIILLSLILILIPLFTNASDKYEVIATKLNVRNGPGTGYDVIGQLEQGEIVIVVDKANSGWYQLNIDKENGYVSATYLKEVKGLELFSDLLIWVGLFVWFIIIPAFIRGSRRKRYRRY